MTPKEIEIVIDAFGKGYVKMDGQELPGVRGVSFQTRAGQSPILAVEILADRYLIKAAAKPDRIHTETYDPAEEKAR